MYLKLKEMLSEYNLKVVYMEMKEPGFYYPKPRIIFLNENLYGETAEAFHLSHELAHFTASHFEYSVLYDTSTTFHSKFETEADKIAILILLNIYIENELTDESQFNLEKFMEYYSIQNKLKYTCYAVCQCYFKKKYSYARQYV
ncbi:TPA: ImmA/IrrE family metallo-endopeptidase [Enterococcus faecium]|uniref:ImmA/IrrE family metallo-endopeptidase n=1 Tax=Enterococcus faecium TaxID=1352 RepID=UPI001B024C98|nr:ImmA/IrrE family metallo-endopeptidase [Enterococcus faecium]EKY7948160.1 ImmA/IrrE family metallo-endopeptidase [Enterococcus faecium]EKZ0477940.1 ImmA/IrrE family metallo-endopeptidase [Enterococcus faecium]MDT0324310.1 ImmA/IrrE family metallo-endopeptidase [Enterococcus faecium]HBA0415344.1 ImmA/IrrE family metallo-endopeptidase [Enterococcus faecium]